MWRVPIEETKIALRKSLMNRRNALPQHECLAWSGRIQSRALDSRVYVTSRSVVLYSSTQKEVGTDEICKNALATGRKVFYPRTHEGGTGEFIRIASNDDLQVGRYHILEPVGGERLADDDQQGLLVFVPGVAFDFAGNRLGRGQGWFDRILASLKTDATLVALAYDFQVVDEVPTEAWDRRVHYIITESKTIECGADTTPLRQASH